MVKPGKLLRHCGDDRRMAMPMKVHPPGRDAVDDLATIGGVKVHAFPTDHMQWIRVERLLGEGMPEVQCFVQEWNTCVSNLERNTSSNASRSSFARYGMWPTIFTFPYFSIASRLPSSSLPIITTPFTRITAERNA